MKRIQLIPRRKDLPPPRPRNPPHLVAVVLDVADVVENKGVVFGQALHVEGFEAFVAGQPGFAQKGLDAVLRAMASQRSPSSNG